MDSTAFLAGTMVEYPPMQGTGVDPWSERIPHAATTVALEPTAYAPQEKPLQ